MAPAPTTPTLGISGTGRGNFVAGWLTKATLWRGVAVMTT